jgi:hypothetical protein
MLALPRSTSHASCRRSRSTGCSSSLPEAQGLKVDQLYRALDVLAAHAEAIQEEVFLKTADLFKLDVDLIFYDTTTAWFTIDAEDQADGLRQRGHAKDGPEGAPQVVIALAVTRDGMPVRSWVLPGDAADVATVAPGSRMISGLGGSAVACWWAMPACTRPTI